MKRLENVFEQMNIPYSSETEEQFRSYMQMILEKNQYINLTAITDGSDFIQKHYIDSLLCADFREFIDAERIIDIGTGAGFPGIPLAIAFPDKDFVLVDSLNKRVKIVNELAASIGLENVLAVHGRAEELARRKDLREGFDLCVSRAVANMSTLCEYCLPFVKLGGWFIAYKGPDSEQEIKSASNAVRILGGGRSDIRKPSVSGLPFDHSLVFIKKVKNTVSKFPRKAGTPSKDPII